MALVSHQFDVPVVDVWAALVDPTTYPEWLVGARRIRAVDRDWPAVGAAFHHRVGFWPLLVDDKSIVQDIRSEELLALEVRATHLVRARVRFCLSPLSDGAGALVALEEEPVYRLIGNLMRPVLDPLTHVRNKRSLQKLARVVARAHRAGT